MTGAGAISERQAYLVAEWADQAVVNLDKALQVAEHTRDLRFIANVRSRRDQVRQLRDDSRRLLRELTDPNEGTP